MKFFSSGLYPPLRVRNRTQNRPIFSDPPPPSHAYVLKVSSLIDRAYMHVWEDEVILFIVRMCTCGMIRVSVERRGLVVGLRTRNPKVVGSIPGCGVITLSKKINLNVLLVCA